MQIDDSNFEIADLQLSSPSSPEGEALSAILQYQMQLMERSAKMERSLGVLEQSVPHILKNLKRVNDTLLNNTVSSSLQSRLSSESGWPPKDSRGESGELIIATTRSGTSGEKDGRGEPGALVNGAERIVGEWRYGHMKCYRIAIENGRLMYTESCEDKFIQAELVQGTKWFEGNLVVKESLLPRGRIRLRLENKLLISNFSPYGSSDWSKDVIAMRQQAVLSEMGQEAVLFEVGQLVERRQQGLDWGKGYVTSVNPLRVTESEKHPGGAGHAWDEVRIITVNGAVDLNTFSTSSAQATQPADKRKLPTHVKEGTAMTATDLVALKEQTRLAPEDIEIKNVSADERRHKRKLTMPGDFDVDDSQLQLKDDAKWRRAVFSNEEDPLNFVFLEETLYSNKGWCQKVARSRLFTNFTVFVIVINAIYLGVDSDRRDTSNLYDAELPFQVCSHFFCLYFTFELGVRFFAFANKFDCIRDGWFTLDLFLVVTMIADVWVLAVVLKLFSGSGTEVTIPTQPLRMLRLLKLSRMVRLMKASPELVMMIKSLVRCLRAVASTIALLGLLVYAWAIIIRLVLNDDDDYNRVLQNKYHYEFSTIGHCMWTLVMTGTLMLDNAAPLMTELIMNSSVDKVFAGVLLMSYTILSALLIFQLIGVLCEIVSQVSRECRDDVGVGLIKQELLDEIQLFNAGRQEISGSQFQAVMDTNRSKALLKKLNINRTFVSQVAALAFPDNDKAIPIRTVLEIMIMCIGDKITTVQVVASAFCFISNALLEMQDDIVGDVRNACNALGSKLGISKPPKGTSSSV